MIEFLCLFYFFENFVELFNNHVVSLWINLDNIDIHELLLKNTWHHGEILIYGGCNGTLIFMNNVLSLFLDILRS